MQIGYMLQSNEFPAASYKYMGKFKTLDGTSYDWTYCTYSQWVFPAHDNAYGATMLNLADAEAKIKNACPW